MNSARPGVNRGKWQQHNAAHTRQHGTYARQQSSLYDLYHDVSTNVLHLDRRFSSSSGAAAVSVDAAMSIDLTADDRALADRILAGDRYALSRGITLVESTKAGDRDRCSQMLMYLLQQQKDRRSGEWSQRQKDRHVYKIGITGMCIVMSYHVISYHIISYYVSFSVGVTFTDVCIC